ncbi:MAG: RNA methyltransferase, partial [Gammaproteobacteria bacterium]|nr:RNA methyltransferase [Gammaproteobacteria bacterium]
MARSLPLNEKFTIMIKSENIKIIMVETTHPGNIGAAARAMKNMCLDNLVLVNPQCPVGQVAFARSSGAHAVLDQMQKFDTLKEAVAGDHLVFGTSARIRSMPMPFVSPENACKEILKRPEDTKVSIVFGREHSGLTNEEMDCCHYALTIPTNEQFSSLNVASAIQVVAYELMKHNTFQNEAEEMELDAAPVGEVNALLEHLEKTLIDIDFLDPLNPKLLMKRLTQLSMRQ